jgi:putative Mg2+ transporter-C (MgtC) family protein
MNALLALLPQPFEFDKLQQLVVANGAIFRLLMACLLGGAIGLERELKRKSAGVRTNLLICMGAAFFTLLSGVMAGDGGSGRGQVASNIVQGIGFLGAGLILHNRSRVSGLASAASIWVVASIGMACGAGLYATSLKSFPMTYEVRGHDQSRMLASILEAMDHVGQRFTDIQSDTIGDVQRVIFPLAATRRQHERLRAELNAKSEIDHLFTFRDAEDD